MRMGPIQDLAQLRPIIHFFKREGFYGRAGYNHTIVTLLTDLIKGFIERSSNVRQTYFWICGLRYGAGQFQFAGAYWKAGA